MWLKICKHLRTANFDLNFTDSYKKKSNYETKQKVYNFSINLFIVAARSLCEIIKFQKFVSHSLIV